MLKKILYFSKWIVEKFTNSNLEKGLSYMVAVLGALLLSTQIGLNTPIRPYLTDVDVFEGKVINQYDNLIEEGRITLQLIDFPSEKDIKILVNGNEAASFTDKTVDIQVRNNAVVEVDGSKIKNQIKVKVVDKSNNVRNEIGKEVIVSSNIKVIDRIMLK